MDINYVSTILSLLVDLLLVAYIGINYKYLNKITKMLFETIVVIFIILWSTTDDYLRLYISLVEIFILLYFIFVIVKNKKEINH